MHYTISIKQILDLMNGGLEMKKYFKILLGLGTTFTLTFGAFDCVPTIGTAAVYAQELAIRVGTPDSATLNRADFIQKYSNCVIIYNNTEYTATNFFDTFKGQNFGIQVTSTNRLLADGTRGCAIVVTLRSNMIAGQVASVPQPTTTPQSTTNSTPPLAATQTQEPTLPITERADDAIFFDKLTLFTSEELIDLAEIAPSQADTRSAIMMTNQKFTDEQVAKWTAEYFEMGGINDFEFEIVRLINEERAKYNLQPLAIMPHYMQAARFKSQEMANLNYFAHKSPVYSDGISDGRGAMAEFFGRNMGSGECLASAGSPHGAVTNWLNSTKGHRESLLSDTIGAVGIGYFNGRATAMFIGKDAQYIGYEIGEIITVTEFINGK